MRKTHDVMYIQNRLEDAGRALISLSGRGTRPALYRCAWPDHIYEFMDIGNWTELHQRFPSPSAAQIQNMDEVIMDWVPKLVDVLDRKIVLARMLTHPLSNRPIYSWRSLGRKFRMSHERVRQLYERSVFELSFRV